MPLRVLLNGNITGGITKQPVRASNEEKGNQSGGDRWELHKNCPARLGKGKRGESNRVCFM